PGAGLPARRGAAGETAQPDRAFADAPRPAAPVGGDLPHELRPGSRLRPAIRFRSAPSVTRGRVMPDPATAVNGAFAFAYQPADLDTVLGPPSECFRLPATRDL